MIVCCWTHAESQGCCFRNQRNWFWSASPMPGFFSFLFVLSLDKFSLETVWKWFSYDSSVVFFSVQSLMTFHVISGARSAFIAAIELSLIPCGIAVIAHKYRSIFSAGNCRGDRVSWNEMRKKKQSPSPARTLILAKIILHFFDWIADLWYYSQRPVI